MNVNYIIVNNKVLKIILKDFFIMHWKDITFSFKVEIFKPKRFFISHYKNITFFHVNIKYIF
jgi:hypothetical protein